jgi:hypothetical protein
VAPDCGAPREPKSLPVSGRDNREAMAIKSVVSGGSWLSEARGVGWDEVWSCWVEVEVDLVIAVVSGTRPRICLYTVRPREKHQRMIDEKNVRQGSQVTLFGDQQ